MTLELIPNEWRYIDAETKQIPPWYVKQVIEMLYSMDLKGKRIFEYGCGDSTLWYRSRGALVWGVDSDEKWANHAKVKYETSYCPYLDEIDHGFKYDIIVIDGIYRDSCLLAAIPYLKNDGFVIIDNWKQPSVEQDWSMTEDLINNHEMKIEVYKEENHQDWQTAIIRL